MMGRANPSANDWFHGIDELGVESYDLTDQAPCRTIRSTMLLAKKRYVLDDGVSSVMKRIAATW
jgi:hypothetical protein